MSTHRHTTYAAIRKALEGLIGSFVELESTIRRPGDSVHVRAFGFLGEPEEATSKRPLYQIHHESGATQITITFAPHDVRVVRTRAGARGTVASIALAP